MPLTVEVSLISGKRIFLEVEPEESVKSLQLRAQKALGAGRGRLLNSAGCILDGQAAVKEVGLQNGDLLTLNIARVQLSCTANAFGGILGDGSLVTWGAFACGGDKSLLGEHSLQFWLMDPS
ncbi:unnamed protein product [Symbiodinium sp. CCMP2592]|nr:unnamed protein product [Symbiodinium sp. CCMP2592]